MRELHSQIYHLIIQSCVPFLQVDLDKKGIGIDPCHWQAPSYLYFFGMT